MGHAQKLLRWVMNLVGIVILDIGFGIGFSLGELEVIRWLVTQV